MKIQDILFLVVVLILIYKRDPKVAAILGIISLIDSIPLFATWTFFTAERFTWYAASFFLLSVLFALLRVRKLQSK